MAQKKQFHILTEDLETIEKVSPSIIRSFESLFFIHQVITKAAKIDYFECRLQYYVLHHANKRRFLTLVHSCHVVACDLYKHDRFTEYMAFDCLLTHLINLL